MSQQHGLIKTNYVTYVSNAGVFIHINNKKILIDALCNSEIPVYKSTPAEISEQIILGIQPFDQIDLMLITHNHSDHFDCERVVRFLQHHASTVVVSTPEVITSIKNAAGNINTDKLIEIKNTGLWLEKIRINDIDLQVMSMLHDGKEYENTDNFAYLIQYGKSVMHLGDAAPARQNFEQYPIQQQDVDLLIANFPYIAIPSARQLVKEHIKPKKIAVVHLPYEELDRFGWIRSAKKNYERVRENFIPAEFLEEIGAKIVI